MSRIRSTPHSSSQDKLEHGEAAAEEQEPEPGSGEQEQAHRAPDAGAAP